MPNRAEVLLANSIPAEGLPALIDLRAEVEAFIELDSSDARYGARYHRVLAAVHRLCAAIEDCELAGVSRGEIVGILDPVRRIHARSPFVKRLQEWPRGYPGDFETVEYLCRGTRDVPAQTIAGICEQYSLTRSVAQQHRNKVQHQAARIMRTMLERPGKARIFSIACGSCPDFRSIAPHLPALLGELWLNDGDAGALDFSLRALEPIRSRCQVHRGNALKVVRKAAQEHSAYFDLVMAGGLFDYLPEKHAVYLIEHAYSLLRPGGVLYFTNIARGNPYRPLIEYFGDWFLIERTEDDIYAYCQTLGIPRDAISIKRDETGLALLIEITKQG
ncbi:MAG TPA: class I SAM-dependent methyltransferase [Thermoanaerobaculia bacterium]|jgi:SAM-dependent methyltransferase|nr:class I SAM-dependent methyltransferase [Thermoanaerobaculia bacterium]